VPETQSCGEVTETRGERIDEKGGLEQQKGAAAIDARGYPARIALATVAACYGLA
jgi:hypothetical protein